MAAERIDVLAYGVIERVGGPIVALKHDREDASDWIILASSEYRNRQMPGPAYRVIELVNAAAVAELIAADEVYDIALSRYFAAFSDGPHGDFGEQREAQTMLRVAKDRRAAALARVQGEGA